MSEPTTGVPAANASVSTMPKLSPPSDGAHRRSRLVRAAATSPRSDTRPATCDALVVEQERLDLLARGAGDREARVHAGGVKRLERAQQDGQSLALVGAPDEEQPQPVAGAAPGPSSAADRSTPFGMMR